MIMTREAPTASRTWRRLSRVVLLAGVALAISSSGMPAQTSAGRPTPGRADVRDGQRIVLITGSTSGLGREVARRLAASGDHVIVHGRSEERGNTLVQEIARAGIGSARFYAADLGSFEDVRALAAVIRRDYDRLDVLVNNAGIALVRAERPISTDGHELHFQVNYLSGYLLTRLLLPLLEASTPARIINVSSLSAAPLDFDNIMLEDGFNTLRAYGQSKLAQVMFTFDLAEELKGTGVTVNALHPATMMNTNMVLSLGLEPQSSVEEGVAAVLHLIDARDLGSGQFFVGQNVSKAHVQAYDRAVRERLRALSDELTGAPRSKLQ